MELKLRKNSKWNRCAVQNCNSNLKNYRFSRVPVPSSNCNQDTCDLTYKRQLFWLAAIGWTDLSDTTSIPELRVCSKHFVSERAAALHEVNNPDWVPSLSLNIKVNCCVPSCNVNDIIGKLHRFPVPLDVRQKWIDIVNNSNLDVNYVHHSTDRICHRHFSLSDYYCLKGKRQSLKKRAVPCLTAPIPETNTEPVHCYDEPVSLLKILKRRGRPRREEPVLRKVLQKRHRQSFTSKQKRVLKVEVKSETDSADERSAKTNQLVEEHSYSAGPYSQLQNRPSSFIVGPIRDEKSNITMAKPTEYAVSPPSNIYINLSESPKKFPDRSRNRTKKSLILKRSTTIAPSKKIRQKKPRRKYKKRRLDVPAENSETDTADERTHIAIPQPEAHSVQKRDDFTSKRPTNQKIRNRSIDEASNSIRTKPTKRVASTLPEINSTSCESPASTTISTNISPVSKSQATVPTSQSKLLKASVPENIIQPNTVPIYDLTSDLPLGAMEAPILIRLMDKNTCPAVIKSKNGEIPIQPYKKPICAKTSGKISIKRHRNILPHPKDPKSKKLTKMMQSVPQISTQPIMEPDFNSKAIIDYLAPPTKPVLVEEPSNLRMKVNVTSNNHTRHVITTSFLMGDDESILGI